MARRKVLIENRLYAFGGKRYKGIELVDNLFLANVDIKDIARILNVEETKFVNTYKTRLDDLELIHKGLLVKAIFDKAFAGDKSSIDTLLTKYNWMEKGDVHNSFLDMLIEATKENSK